MKTKEDKDANLEDAILANLKFPKRDKQRFPEIEKQVSEVGTGFIWTLNMIAGMDKNLESMLLGIYANIQTMVVMGNLDKAINDNGSALMLEIMKLRTYLEGLKDSNVLVRQLYEKGACLKKKDQEEGPGKIQQEGPDTNL